MHCWESLVDVSGIQHTGVLSWHTDFLFNYRYNFLIKMGILTLCSFSLVLFISLQFWCVVANSGINVILTVDML